MTLSVEQLMAGLALVNLMGFVLMGVDKHRARNGRWRIAEKTLWTVALLGGALGTLLGMRHFRHKTKHWQFRYGLPILLTLQLGAGGWLALHMP